MDTRTQSCLPAEPARTERPAAGSAWQAERERILVRLCRRLRARRAKGQPIRTAARRLAHAWKGRHYRSRPDMPVRVSPGFLVRTYYRLVRNDWRTEAIRCRYVIPPRRTLPRALAAEFLRRTLNRHGGNGAEAFRQMVQDWRSGIAIPGIPVAASPDARFPFSLSSFYRRTPGRVVRCLAASRRKLRRDCQALVGEEMAHEE